MDRLSREYLRDFYSKRLMLHGDSPAALHWSEEGQRARFEAMMQLAGPLEGRRVLDYGCGKADLYAFLLSRGIGVDYTGIDINPDLISLAREKYPECSFMEHDIEDGPVEGEFDTAFICGVFNCRVDGATESMKNSMRLLFRHVSGLMVINALSSRSTNKGFELNYVDPEELLDYSMEHVSPDSILRLDLIEGDLFLLARAEGQA